MHANLTEKPYPGLRPFQYEESYIFFGREEHSDQLLDKLRDTRFISVVAVSVRKKSSLIHAGMIAALRSGYLSSAGARWRVAEMRPGEAPLKNLSQALLSEPVLFEACAKALTETPSSPEILLPIIHDVIQSSSYSLVEIVRRLPLPPNTNLLIYVDQFEEIFRYAEENDYTQAEPFVKLLLASARQNEVPIYVVMSMRSDFIGQCAHFYDLPEAINSGQFLVPRLTPEQQQAAIEGPAGVFGGTLEPALVARLLDEMNANPHQDKLPLLQHCLMRMWPEHLTTDQECTLTLQDYERVGGLEHALNAHIEEVYASLNDSQQHLAKPLFQCITERTAKGQDIRHPMSLRDIAKVAGSTVAEIQEIIEVFRDPSRCFLMPPAHETLMSASIIDITHESLIRQWKRLQSGVEHEAEIGWIEQEAESAEIYKQLERDAQRKAALWRHPDLGLALRWYRDNKPTAAWAERYSNGAECYGEYFDSAIKFLLDSKQEEERRKAKEEQRRAEEEAKRRQAEEERKVKEEEERKREQRLRYLYRILGITSMAMLVVIGLTVWALWERSVSRKLNVELERTVEVAQKSANVAQQEKSNAERAERLARSEGLAAQARTARLEGYPQRSLLLALEAVNVTLNIAEPRRPSAEEALRETLANIGGKPLGLYSEGIRDISVSSDGRWLAILDNQKRVELQDLQTTYSESLLTTDVQALAFSANSQVLLTCGADQIIRQWDIGDGSPVETGSFRHFLQGTIERLAISPDNRWLFMMNRNGDAHLWKFINADVVEEPTMSPWIGKNVWAVVFSSDAQWLITGGDDGTISFWNLASEDFREASSLAEEGVGKKIVEMALSPDNQWLTARNMDGSVHLWKLDLQGLAAHWIDTLPHSDIQAVAMSPHSQWLLTGNPDNTIGIWSLFPDISMISPVFWHGHEGAVTAIEVSAASHLLVSASKDGSIRQWDLTANNRAITPQILQGSGGKISAMALTSDAHWLVSGNEDSTFEVWNLTGDVPSQTFSSRSGLEGRIEAIGISPDGRWVVTGGEDATVRLWDLRPTEAHELSVSLLAEYKSKSSNVVFSPDGRWAIVGSERETDSVIQAYDLTSADPAETARLLVESNGVASPLALSSDNQWLLTGNDKDALTLWEYPENEKLSVSYVIQRPAVGTLRSAFSPDNRWLAIGSEDGNVWLWNLTQNVQANTPLVLSGYVGKISNMAFSPDGRWLVSGGEDAIVRRWDLNAANPAQNSLELRGHEGPVTSLAISADNRWLVTGSQDATARIWELAAAQPEETAVVLRGHQSGITSLNISQDDRKIMTGSADGTIRVWWLQMADLRKAACRAAGRNLSSDEGETYFRNTRYRETCSEFF